MPNGRSLKHQFIVSMKNSLRTELWLPYWRGPCRNRTDDDGSHEEARERESELFQTHPSLSQLDKASVGIASLADRLTQIQANIIRTSLPGT